MAALEEIARGLWRWTALHPEWRPDAAPETPADWPREVGCVLCETSEATVFIDPLLPPDDPGFLDALDGHISRRGRPVAVLTTIGFHRRSGDELTARYGASTSRAKKSLPAGIDSLPIRGAGETMFWLAEHRALVPGDRLIGAADGRLRLCPESWRRYLPSGMNLAELAEGLEPLLDLEIELVLVSHGDPVLSRGRETLEAALAAAG